MVKTRASERPLLWLGLWFVCNLLITLGTKGTCHAQMATFSSLEESIMGRAREHSTLLHATSRLRQSGI